MKLTPALVITATDVMNGFCWAYANALVQKLWELQAQNRLFDSRGPEYGATQLGKMVLTAITQQFGVTPSNQDIGQFVHDADEFLASFKKE